MNNKEFPQQANMPYPMPYQDNDEIDLIELFRTLWKQKVKIALVTAATTLAAGIYAFTAEEVWTSKAIFSPPKLEEINDYYTATQQLKRILQKPSMGAIALSPEIIAQETYDEFKKQLDSDDLRNEFWLTTDYYAEKVKDKTSGNDKSKILNELTEENIKFEQADGKKILHPYVTLSADTASDAKTLLEKYLNKVNEQVWQVRVKEFNTVLSQEMADLKHEKERLVFNAETYRDNNIKMSENAKNIAEKANIKELNINAMQGNANVDKTDMLFFLGTKALDAQIDNLKNKPVTLPLRYYEIERILSEMKKIPALNNLNVKGYHYLMSPNEPVVKDKPKRIIILVLGIVFGMTISCIGVLVYNWNDKKN